MRLKASATVEAVFIFPVIIIVLMAMLLLIMHLYDRIKLKSDLNMGIEYAREQYQKHREINTGEILDFLDVRMGKGYMLCEINNLEVIETGNGISIQAILEMKGMSSKGNFGLFDTFREKEIVVCGEINDREKTVRRIDAGVKLWEELTGRNAD